jgi:hypothetical protein
MAKYITPWGDISDDSKYISMDGSIFDIFDKIKQYHESKKWTVQIELILDSAANTINRYNKELRSIAIQESISKAVNTTEPNIIEESIKKKNIGTQLTLNF